MSNWVFHAGKAIVIGLCLYLAYVAGKWGLADYYAEQSYQVVLAWRQGAEVTEASWSKTHEALSKALALDPAHPTYHHRMGRLYHIRMQMDPVRRGRYGEQAMAHFRRSLEVRPYWPLTWANLALVKRDLLQFDNELNEALVNAATYGAWEPGVHEMLAEIGLPYLYAFSGEGRAAIAGSISRGLVSPVRGAPEKVLAKLAQYRLMVDQDLATTLERMLLQREWTDAKEVLYTRVALLLWHAWSPAGRRALAREIAGSADRRPVLRLVDQHDRLEFVCPWLPRDDKFDRFCSDQKFR